MAETQKLTIQLDAKDDASKKIQDAGKKIEGVAKGIGDTVKKISVLSAGALTAFSAFAIKSVKDLGGVAEELDNMHKSTGLAVQSLSALKFAADQTSVPLGTMTTGVKKLQLAQADLKGFKDNLEDIGLTSKEILNIPIEEQFFKIGNAIAKLPDATDRTIMSMQFFGKAGTDLLPIFGEGANTLEEWSAQAKKAGLVLDQGTIDSALKADQAFDDYDATMRGLVQTISGQLLPVVTQMIEGIAPVIQQVTEWIAKNPQLTATMVEWTLAVLAGSVALGGIVKTFEGLSVVVKALGTMSQISTALTGMSLLQFGGIVALVAGLAYILANWDSIAKGIRGIADQLGLVSNNANNAAEAMANWYAPGEDHKGTKDKNGTVTGSVPVFKNTTLGAAPSTPVQPTYKQAVDLGIAQVWGSLRNSLADAVTSVTGYANGGRPSVGELSVVGENGPEYFVPDRAGTVLPNSRVGSSPVYINITGNTLLDSSAAIKIGDLIMGELRLQKRF